MRRQGVKSEVVQNCTKACSHDTVQDKRAQAQLEDHPCLNFAVNDRLVYGIITGVPAGREYLIPVKKVVEQVTCNDAQLYVRRNETTYSAHLSLPGYMPFFDRCSS